MDTHSFSSQVEVLSVTDSGRRRRWSAAEKIRIVEESLSRPRSVALTARRHDISRSLLTRWRKDYREGLLGIDLPRACSGDDARDPVYRLLAPATTLAQCQGGYDGRLHVPALQRQVNKLAADLLPIYGELRLVWLLPVRAFSPFVIE